MNVLPPRNWPSKHVRYITSNIYDLDEIETNTNVVIQQHKIRLRKVPKNHPAYSPEKHKGFGVFAVQFIAEGEVIGEYTGLLVQRFRTNCSDYTIDGNKDYDIDAEFAGNEMRFINDYRGIAQRENVYYTDAYPGSLECVVVARRNIAPGEELLADYGEGYWLSRKVYRKVSNTKKTFKNVKKIVQ